MELVIIAGCVLALLAIEKFVATHQKASNQMLPAGTVERQPIRTEPVIDDAPQIAVTHEDAERALTALLCAGELDPATYRGDMATIAATEQQVSGVSPLRMTPAQRHSHEQLGAAMPALSPATLFAAVALAHHGATVEDLTRLLELTTVQALRVVTTTTGNAHRQP